MSRTIDSAEEIRRDSFLFAAKHEELTVLGTSEKPLEEYPKMVFTQPKLEGQLPVGANEPELLHRTKATVFEVSDQTVRLKMGENVFVNIPKVVFSGKEEILKYGQAIYYSIKRRANGFRFQDIDLDTTAVENPLKQDVLAVLDAIPQRR